MSSAFAAGEIRRRLESGTSSPAAARRRIAVPIEHVLEGRRRWDVFQHVGDQHTAPAAGPWFRGRRRARALKCTLAGGQEQRTGIWRANVPITEAAAGQVALAGRGHPDIVRAVHLLDQAHEFGRAPQVRRRPHRHEGMGRPASEALFDRDGLRPAPRGHPAMRRAGRPREPFTPPAQRLGPARPCVQQLPLRGRNRRSPRQWPAGPRLRRPREACEARADHQQTDTLRRRWRRHEVQSNTPRPATL